MCGRFALRNPQQVKEKLSISTSVEPRYNIAPGQKVLVTDNNTHFIKCGFTPYWAEKPFNLINARAETLAEKPSFKNSNRCLIPCLLYTSPSPRDQRGSRMPSSA